MPEDIQDRASGQRPSAMPRTGARDLTDTGVTESDDLSGGSSRGSTGDDSGEVSGAEADALDAIDSLPDDVRDLAECLATMPDADVASIGIAAALRPALFALTDDHPTINALGDAMDVLQWRLCPRGRDREALREALRRLLKLRIDPGERRDLDETTRALCEQRGEPYSGPRRVLGMRRLLVITAVSSSRTLRLVSLRPLVIQRAAAEKGNAGSNAA